jgi:AraC family transcriptional regulator
VWFSAQQSPPVGILNQRSAREPTCASKGEAKTALIHPPVEISPPEEVIRRTVTGYGMTAESVQSSGQRKVQYHFCAPMHLLVMHEKGGRHDGETFVECLPQSRLRNLERKLTFVPAGHEYREWREPRGQTRLMHFYFDPAKLDIHLEPDIADKPLAPRLFFEDATLWDTALKLKTLVESPSGDPLYFETLGTLLIHELVRLSRGVGRIQPQVRGGLAPWQQRIAIAHIEEHLDEQIPLATLARLVRLNSPQYFCRLFKQSLGMPPHRYQTNCRMEHAKLLLARPTISVTDIGLTVGFGSSNAFTTAFRKVTGLTPTDYRRSLASGHDCMNRSPVGNMSGVRA